MMSVQQVLDFVRTAYQVNAAVEGAAVNVDWNALSSNHLLSALTAEQAVGEDVSTSSLEDEGGGGARPSLGGSPHEKTASIRLCSEQTPGKAPPLQPPDGDRTVGERKHEQKRLTNRRRSSGGSIAGQKEGCKEKENTARSNMKRRVNQVLQEGILDSVLPYMLSNSKRLPLPPISPAQSTRHEERLRLNSREVPEKPDGPLPLPGYIKRDIRRKSTSSLDCKTTDKKDCEVVIHVCDEVNNTKKDLRCPQNLLVSRMRYFAQVTAGQRLDEMDISVHCDVSIFEWLIRWVKTEGSPTLNTSIVIPVLMSSAFLQMDALEDLCLEFCRSHINEVIRDSANLGCINDSVLSRLAGMFSNSELETVKDRKDKLVSKMYCKFIMFLTEVVPQAKRGHYASIAYMFRCSKCGQIVCESGSGSGPRQRVNCVPSMMRVDIKGVVVSEHAREASWSLTEYVRSVRTQLLTWRKVYWRLWALAHHLFCSHCNSYFPVAHISKCRFHPEHAQFFSMEHQRTMSLPVGRYPCCGEKSFRFEPLPRLTGCQVRDHTPDVRSDTARAIMQIFKQHRELIRIVDEQPSDAATAAAPALISTGADASASALSWQGLQLAPALPEGGHQGLLGRWMDLLLKPQDPRGSSESKTATVVVPSWRPVPTAGSAGSESSSGRSSPGGSESGDSGEEDSGGESYHAMLTVTAKPRHPPSSLPIAPSARKDLGHTWQPKLSTRCNQDNQREFEERAMRQIQEFLTKKTAANALRSGHQSANPLNPAGGTYVRVEAEWRGSHCSSHGCPASSKSSASASTSLPLPATYKPKSKR